MKKLLGKRRTGRMVVALCIALALVFTGIPGGLVPIMVHDAVADGPSPPPPPPPPPPGGDDDDSMHAPPLITDFDANNVYQDSWFIEGRVTGCDNVAGLTITFGYVADGKTATTGTDGTFLLIMDIDPGTVGAITATTVCHQGVESNEAYIYLDGGFSEE